VAKDGVYFVTRLKENVDFMVIQEFEPPRHRNILAVQHILFAGCAARKDCPHVLRRIVGWDVENKREIVLLSNHLEFSATTIFPVGRIPPIFPDNRVVWAQMAMGSMGGPSSGV
jgi:hypothetical protein